MLDLDASDVFAINSSTIERQISCEQLNEEQTDIYRNRQQGAKTHVPCNTNTEEIKIDNTNPSVKDNYNSKITSFFPGPSREVDIMASANIRAATKGVLRCLYRDRLF